MYNGASLLYVSRHTSRQAAADKSLTRKPYLTLPDQDIKFRTFQQSCLQQKPRRRQKHLKFTNYKTINGHCIKSLIRFTSYISNILVENINTILNRIFPHKSQQNKLAPIIPNHQLKCIWYIIETTPKTVGTRGTIFVRFRFEKRIDNCRLSDEI